MSPNEAIAILDNALAKIELLRASYAHSAAHIEFIQTTGLELGRIFGASSTVTKNFCGIDYFAVGRFIATASTMEGKLQGKKREAYQRGLDIAEGVLRSARSQLQQHGVDRILRLSRARSGGARVFISHAGQTNVLARIESFIRSIGLYPIVVARGPSEGLSVDALVDKRMNESDCAIILATSDEAVSKRKQPRPNVLHEIGLAQAKFGDKVIYLKEEGCEFPSNVNPKVWENFTRDNLEFAFEKIAKELRAFDLL
jgi:predicted nucleotide-binding protein